MRRIIIGAAALAAIVSFASSPHAHAAGRTECIVFEDDSFMCGTATPGRWLDRTKPMIVGCIPDGLCDSPEWREDNLYSEVVFPDDDPRYPVE